MKTAYSHVGMAYLKPRLKYTMNCTQYVFHREDEAKKENLLQIVGVNSICLPDNGGPCIYGSGCIKNFKYWRGTEEPPIFDQELVTRFKDGSLEGFYSWIECLIKKYPQVNSVKLFGSRATGEARPNSDWDVLLELHKINNFKQITKQISFDNDLCFKRFGADVWFLRPDGLVMKYSQRGLEKFIESLSGFQHHYTVRDRNPMNDPCCKTWFSKIYEDIQKAIVVYERE